MDTVGNCCKWMLQQSMRRSKKLPNFRNESSNSAARSQHRDIERETMRRRPPRHGPEFVLSTNVHIDGRGDMDTFRQVRDTPTRYWDFALDQLSTPAIRGGSVGSSLSRQPEIHIHDAEWRNDTDLQTFLKIWVQKLAPASRNVSAKSSNRQLVATVIFKYPRCLRSLRCCRNICPYSRCRRLSQQANQN